MEIEAKVQLALQKSLTNILEDYDVLIGNLSIFRQFHQKSRILKILKILNRIDIEDIAERMHKGVNYWIDMAFEVHESATQDQMIQIYERYMLDNEDKELTHPKYESVQCAMKAAIHIALRTIFVIEKNRNPIFLPVLTDELDIFDDNQHEIDIEYAVRCSRAYLEIAAKRKGISDLTAYIEQNNVVSH